MEALYIKDNQIMRADEIIIVKDGMQIINPTAEQLLEDGWTLYVPVQPEHEPILVPNDYEVETAIMVRIRKREEQTIRDEFATLSDQEALEVKALAPAWIEQVGKPVKTGERYFYDEKLFKVRQDHTVLENNPPSEATASLYEEINEKNAGTFDDPIPYDGNMRLELGKYYTQDGIKYKCTRDSEIAVFQPLSDLVGIYVEVATD